MGRPLKGLAQLGVVVTDVLYQQNISDVHLLSDGFQNGLDRFSVKHWHLRCFIACNVKQEQIKT